VYIIHNLPLDLRYKKKFIIPVGFILGPQKMKDSNFFLYPLLYHISVLQGEGLWIWDASMQTHISWLTLFILVTANSPVMAIISGMVGHSGKFSCCLYYGLPGHYCERDRHYYPVMLKPNAYNVTGCDHGNTTCHTWTLHVRCKDFITIRSLQVLTIYRSIKLSYYFLKAIERDSWGLWSCCYCKVIRRPSLK
jgi:hypothetical protein